MRSPSPLEVGWGALAAGCVVAMVAWPSWETIPFHVIWITLTLLYGFRVWSPSATSLALGAVIVATGASIMADAFEGIQLWGELFEVPLMSAMFLAMVWHARRRKTALETAAALADEQARVLELEEQLLHDVSHELRTPVTIARLQLERLELDLQDRPRPLDIAFDELGRIERIVERLLLLARVEGERPLAAQPVALVQFLEDVFMRWADLAPRAWQLGDVADVTIVADEMLLRTALDALLENAVQYTDDYDRIALSARGERDEIVISVADAGVGVEPSARERIFDRFARSDESRSRHEGGAGLGLAMVAAIARAHGGSCRVAPSSPGSVFELRLPLAHAARADLESAPGALAAPASA
ncbi:MAG TPA: HAMP domain-containing sensor histidine kinase [Gaiellaceae bacterium]|nr:HAMP domain-containing sensor histidine kinase [Gaiellaceae bacterium]